MILKNGKPEPETELEKWALEDFHANRPTTQVNAFIRGYRLAQKAAKWDNNLSYKLGFTKQVIASLKEKLYDIEVTVASLDKFLNEKESENDIEDKI